MKRAQHPLIGSDVPLQEGSTLIRGRGLFTSDVVLNAPLTLSILRSPLANAQFPPPDTNDALSVPSVCAVYLAGDLAGLGALSVNPILPMSQSPSYPILADSNVNAVGQPIAAILASTPEAGADAAEMIDVEYTETPPPEETIVAQQSWQSGAPQSAFSNAAFVVETQVSHPVLAPSPMEPRAIAVSYDTDSDHLTIWHSTQTPHRTRASLAQILGIDPARLRVIAANVGGAFGMKASIYPEEVLAVWAALKHRRDVRWSATRSDDFQAATHGRGITSSGRLALEADGKFLALEATFEVPLGYWLPNSALIPAWNAARILPGAYDIPALNISTCARLTARPPMGIYRGAGRPEANMLMERLVEQAALACGLDSKSLRARNLWKPDQLPRDTATGNRLDSGDYGRALERLPYQAALTRRDTRRKGGKLAGVGIGFYLEPSGQGWESARVTLANDLAVIASGSSAQGQSRATAYAQIAADALNLPLSAITVTYGDTATCPEGIGALASRSTPIGGSAVLAACRAVTQRRENGEMGEITEDIRYEASGQAWGYGVFMAELCVDGDTGVITLDQLTCIDDTGTIINPSLVKDQIIGGAAQGLGEALMERMVFDEDGQLLTGSLMDYALPRAADMAPITIYSIQTPSPMNILGAKGVGEAGTIGAPIAILNAALDALAQLGVEKLDMPLTPFRVWQAIIDAKKDIST